jgi:hypothetical protein
MLHAAMVLALLLGGAWANGMPPQRYVLLREWQVKLGRIKDLGLAPQAVCSDGTVYALSPGRVVQVVSPDGRKALQGPLTGLPKRGVQDIACGSDGRLYVLGRKLVIFAPDASGNLRKVADRGSPSDAKQVAPAPDGPVYLLRASAEPSLCLLAENGKRRTIFTLGPAPWPWIQTLNPLGVLALDPHNASLIYIPPPADRAYLFDATGRLLKKVPTPGLATIASFGHPLPSREMFNLAALPGGRFVAGFVSQSSDVTTEQTSLYIELLDGDLKIASSPIPSDGFGFLLGASADGALYFRRFIRGKGLYLVKARLGEAGVRLKD